MNRFLYTLLLHLGLPLVGLRLLLRARKAPAYARRIGERFSLGLPAMRPGGIWVHAVSVGESIAAAPMIRELMARHPELPITVTCMTPTGSERIRALFGDQVQHCYLPYDLPWAAARFLDRVRPRLAVVMETELWPNHIHQCARRGIAVVLANARLSERSARGYARLSRLTAPMLAELDWLAVQSEAEAERFRRLGARPERISVTGSIKFDLHVDPALAERAAELRARWGAEQRPVWIAASTHRGEDEVILQAHRHLLERHPDALLILVPRHPERFDDVAALCAPFGVARRSRDPLPTPEQGVWLGDTMGELMRLYGCAEVAFVGGSLVPVGGHNFLEPACWGLPLLSGPHLHNFAVISQLLREADALTVVPDEHALAAALRELLDDRARMRGRGEAAAAVVAAHRGALQRVLSLVSSFWPG